MFFDHISKRHTSLRLCSFGITIAFRIACLIGNISNNFRACLRHSIQNNRSYLCGNQLWVRPANSQHMKILTLMQRKDSNFNVWILWMTNRWPRWRWFGMGLLRFYVTKGQWPTPNPVGTRSRSSSPPSLSARAITLILATSPLLLPFLSTPLPGNGAKMFQFAIKFL